MLGRTLKIYRENTLAVLAKVLIISALFAYLSPVLFSQFKKNVARNMPFVFENLFTGNGSQLTWYICRGFEGSLQRIKNAEVKDSAVNEKIMGYVDVAQAIKNWYFKNFLMSDEFLLRFACEDDYLIEGTFRLCGVTLSVTYV
jgi:hypothetical protein